MQVCFGIWSVLATKGVRLLLGESSSYPPHFSLSARFLSNRRCRLSVLPSLYLTHTSSKFEWNVIPLQIGSRASKSFYKYSSDSPDNHKINWHEYTQHCSANSYLSLSAKQASSSPHSTFCLPHALVIAWELYAEKEQQRNHNVQERNTNKDRAIEKKSKHYKNLKYCTYQRGNKILNWMRGRVQVYLFHRVPAQQCRTYAVGMSIVGQIDITNSMETIWIVLEYLPQPPLARWQRGLTVTLISAFTHSVLEQKQFNEC